MSASRRVVTALFAAALLSTLPQAANAQSTPEKRKLNVATASLGLPYLPLIIAQQRKYFADEGSKWRSPPSRAVQGAAVADGRIERRRVRRLFQHADHGGEGPEAEELRGAGGYPALTIAVSKRVADRYKSPKDLKGMKIGVSAPGSSTHMIVNHLLSRAKLHVERHVDHRRRHLGRRGCGMEKGEVDAIINSDPVMTKSRPTTP